MLHNFMTFASLFLRSYGIHLNSDRRLTDALYLSIPWNFYEQLICDLYKWPFKSSLWYLNMVLSSHDYDLCWFTQSSITQIFTMKHIVHELVLCLRAPFFLNQSKAFSWKRLCMHLPFVINFPGIYPALYRSLPFC